MSNHDGQLTIGDLERKIAVIKAAYPNCQDFPVYIGNDDELNGVHCAWNINRIPVASKDKNGWRDLINYDYCNHKLEDDKQALIIF